MSGVWKIEVVLQNALRKTERILNRPSYAQLTHPLSSYIARNLRNLYSSKRCFTQLKAV
jgi:hypothetical protein